jgi:hypothetical protein
MSSWIRFGYIVFGVLLSLSVVFSHGISTVHFYTELYADPIKMREIFGASDAGSHLWAAMQLDSINALPPEENWIINFWPPGMLVLEALILRFLQNDLYFGVVLGVFTAFGWGSFLGYIAGLVHKLHGKLLAILLLVFVVSVGPIHDWILNYGLFYADGFGTLFLLVGITFLILSHRENYVLSRKLSHGVLAGISFAISAYFRATYINILYALLATGIACLLVFVILKIRRNGRRHLTQIMHAIESAAIFFIAAVAMFICVNPWMTYVESEISGTREWSAVGDSFINGMWVDRDEMPWFLREGGIGWACKIDPEKCAELSKLRLTQPNLDITHKQLSEAILVALKNPGEYALDRGKFIGIAWISSELGQIWLPPELGRNLNVFNYPFSVLNLVGLIGFFVILIKRFTSSWPLLLSITAIYSILLIPLLIGHLEIRYLLPFKLLPLLLPIATAHIGRQEFQLRASKDLIDKL